MFCLLGFGCGFVFFFSLQKQLGLHLPSFLSHRNEGSQNAYQHISGLGAPCNCVPFQPLLWSGLHGFPSQSDVVKASLTGTDYFLWDFTTAAARLALLFYLGRSTCQPEGSASMHCRASWPMGIPCYFIGHAASCKFLVKAIYCSPGSHVWLGIRPSRAFLKSGMFCFQQCALKQEIKINAA